MQHIVMYDEGEGAKAARGIPQKRGRLGGKRCPDHGGGANIHIHIGKETSPCNGRAISSIYPHVCPDHEDCDWDD